jgi:hypothetical protein
MLFWISRCAIDPVSTWFYLLDDDAEAQESYFGAQLTFVLLLRGKPIWKPSQYLSMCLDE